MAAPTLISELSTTAGSNGPAGSVSPIELDDYARAHAAFIAQLRDEKAPIASPTLTGTATIPAITGLVSVNGGQLAGLRNRIINGNFGVNQDSLSGSVVLSAGAYGHDMWKAGASGCTYTFATSANVTTLTISAGSLQQVIEGVNLESGTYALSWSGTATGKIDAGSYSASGVTGAVTGGTDTTVEFSTGTVSKVQFEIGTATTFERRPYGQELALCQRYYWLFSAGGYVYAPIAPCQTPSSTTYAGYLQIPVVMRSTPTIAVSTGGGSMNVWNSAGSAIAVSTLSTSASANGISISGTVASGLLAGGATFLLGDLAGSAKITASARL